MIKMDIEQIILQSTVTGLVHDRLKIIPFEDQPYILGILSEIISPHFEETRVNGVWRIKAVFGYIGADRRQNPDRILWRREFSEALPPLKSKEDYRYHHGKVYFGFVLDGKEYLFNKTNGSCLGCFPNKRT